MSVTYAPDDWEIVATDSTPANRSVSGYSGQIPNYQPQQQNEACVRHLLQQCSFDLLHITR